MKIFLKEKDSGKLVRQSGVEIYIEQNNLTFNKRGVKKAMNILDVIIDSLSVDIDNHFYDNYDYNTIEFHPENEDDEETIRYEEGDE